jgi:HSP90 family molecular chaperone
LCLEPNQEETKSEGEELVPLKGERFKAFAMWFKEILSGKVTTVTETTRLSNSPAVIVDHESAAFRRAMRFVDPQRAPQLPKQQIQINPKHPIIIKLDSLRHTEPELAKEIAEQVFCFFLFLFVFLLVEKLAHFLFFLDCDPRFWIMLSFKRDCWTTEGR